MRKSLWIILAALFVASGAPTAHADSYTNTFTFDGTSATPIVFDTPSLISFNANYSTTSGADGGLPVTSIEFVGPNPGQDIGTQICWTEGGASGCTYVTIYTLPFNSLPLSPWTEDIYGVGGPANLLATLTVVDNTVATPENGSLGLLGLGLAGVVGLCWWRKRNLSQPQQAT